jgi:hypothetical protein
VLLVAADLALVDELLQVVHDVAPDVPDCDASVLRHLPGNLDELLAPLLGQLRDRQRMILPSFDGVRPRSDSWIVRSIDCSELGSNGCTVSRRGSAR